MGMEYLNLWMQQSQLFWSRLQTATALHTAVLTGWYFIKPEEKILKISLLGIGIVISGLILRIMIRDSQYMEAMKEKSKDDLHWPPQSCFGGRRCGYLLVIVFIIIEFTLIIKTICESGTL